MSRSRKTPQISKNGDEDFEPGSWACTVYFFKTQVYSHCVFFQDAHSEMNEKPSNAKCVILAKVQFFFENEKI